MSDPGYDFEDSEIQVDYDHEDAEYKCTLCKHSLDRRWGMEVRELCRQVKDAHEKISRFRKNIHPIPANKTGKAFLNIYAEALEWAAKENIEEHFGWYAATVLPAICLQIGDIKATLRQKTDTLKLNLEKIETGRISDVIISACKIQDKLKKRRKLNRNKRKINWVTRARTKVQQGEIGQAARALEENETEIVTPTNDSIQKIGEMYPRSKPSSETTPKADPTRTALTHFTPSQIRKAIQSIQGSGGISQIDAKAYRRIINNKTFKTEGNKIVNALAEATNKIAYKYAEEETTMPLRALRMIAIKKPDGSLRPIGIGEIPRRIITKVIAWEIKNDVKEATGSIQCQGLTGACEAAIEAMNEMYAEGKSILVLDAEGAFNNLNRGRMLKNVHRQLPEAYQAIRNLYENPTPAYHGEHKLQIEEGTIQGCALSTAIYDIGISPLVKEMQEEGIQQIWMVDDLGVAGNAETLKNWFKTLRKRGPTYGYKPKKGKCYLISKDQNAANIFQKEIKEGLLTQADGTRYLGGPIGAEDFKLNFFKMKAKKLTNKIEKVIKLGKTSPHSAYHLYTRLIKHELTYLQRIGIKEEQTEDISSSLRRLVEQIIGENIRTEKGLEEISNPLRYGGLDINITRLKAETREKRKRCKEVTRDLKEKLIAQDPALPPRTSSEDYNKQREKDTRTLIRQQIEGTQDVKERRRREELNLKCTGNWLTAPPIKARGHYLSKKAFEDAIRIRMGLEPKEIPRICACGQRNNLTHTQNCHRGGYINLRHDSIRDVIHKNASKAFHDTEIEPRLNPVEDHTLPSGANTTEHARTDIRIKSFLRDFQDTHFDIQVINTQADSHLQHTPMEAMKKAEDNKNRLYKERLQMVENATFIPMIFTTKGARARATSRALNRIATRCAAKNKEDQKDASKRISTELSFLFLKIELACVRGRRQTRADQYQT